MRLLLLSGRLRFPGARVCRCSCHTALNLSATALARFDAELRAEQVGAIGHQTQSHAWRFDRCESDLIDSRHLLLEPEYCVAYLLLVG